MARGSKVQKPKRSKTRGVKAGARKAPKRKMVKPGTRAVYKRRVTTYDLTLQERDAFADLAETLGQSTSELLAYAARNLVASFKVAMERGIDLHTSSPEASQAAMREVFARVPPLQSPTHSGAVNVLNEIAKDAGTAADAAQRVVSPEAGGLGISPESVPPMRQDEFEEPPATL